MTATLVGTEPGAGNTAPIVPRPRSGLHGQLRLQVLGHLRVWRGEREIETAPRQQAYLLALLLARAGYPTGTGELIDMIWGEEAPASALNVIHKYVGSLRRLLEPDLPPRGTGVYLLRRGNGYVCAVGADHLDLTRFRDELGAARAASQAGDGAGALGRYHRALQLWSGPAGAGWAHGPAATSIFAGLNDEYFHACIEATGLALTFRQPARLLPSLHLAASIGPLHEPVHASLIALLDGAGRQAEALNVFHTVRRRLADELGIDPGAALRAAHQRVLTQAPPDPVVTSTRRTRERLSDVPIAVAPLADAEAPAGGPWTEPTAGADGLVGRSDELAELRRSVAPALDHGTAVVMVEGEPGIGKSRLLEELAVHSRDRGALVIRGRCLEGEGTPTMWPWVEAVSQLLEALPSARREHWLARDLGHLAGYRASPGTVPPAPDSNARFRLMEQVVSMIAEVADERPVVLILDDLQWADTSSLRLLVDLLSRMPAGAAVVGALRSRGPSPSLELVRTLAAASRAGNHRRLQIRPLGPTEVAELIHVETGVRLDPEVAASVHNRTAGNPFFVQELGRLWAASGDVTPETATSSVVPATVRDVVRDRLAVLDADTRQLLEVAALIGRNVELPVLSTAASLEVMTCLDRLEPVSNLGLLGPVPDDPLSYWFTHDLVRQVVGEAIPLGRTATLHGAIADALEKLDLGDESVSERVAHHLWAAGPVVDPARTVRALVRAGARATAKTALGAAERHLGSAVELARRASLLDLELTALAQLIAVVGMRSMYGTASVSLLERAEQVAQRLGRDRDAAGFLFSRWTAHGQALDMARSTPLARRLDEQGRTSDDPVIRYYGTAAAGIHEWCTGNVGGSYRRLSALSAADLAGDDGRTDPVRDGVQLMAMGMFAEIAGYHGETVLARGLLDTVVTAAGDNPYAVTAAASFEARTAAVVGDPAWALRAAQRGIAVDPHFSFVSLGAYLRLARCWALAMTGREPTRAADDAERLIRIGLTNPTRTCVSTWYALLGEMRIAAGEFGHAAAALDNAEERLERHGQRSAEALVILVRAQLARAVGDDAVAVDLARKARSVATRQGAHLFAKRADQLLDLPHPARRATSRSTTVRRPQKSAK
ncbi:ATP-binding protein [Micromonospora sp. NBS 11-29]|uniref:ATP-binding protein n=1 Tax=Micromonospora sp. NBS 11-29 TaxID=1960879 RepID=UPI000B785263|nr:BTAD domain-containing putative transcriptional regulator [Micromonospora sp. NBS 11-29]